MNSELVRIRSELRTTRARRPPSTAQNSVPMNEEDGLRFEERQRRKLERAAETQVVQD